MDPQALIQLISQIRRQKYETQTIEVKAAAHGTPRRLYDTLSSFSNQDTGGTLVFGLDEKDGYALCGVFDPQQLQHEVAEQCKQMEPEVRPLITVARIDGKAVVAAEIPPCDISDRPVFYKGSGRLRGSYVRVGEADEPMSEYEIYSYEAFRRRIRDDLRPVEGAGPAHLRADAVEAYLAAVRRKSRHLSDYADRDEILELTGITRQGAVTLAGALAFGKYPQAWFPRLCITAVVVPGLQMGDTGEGGERFLANETITGTLPELLNDSLAFVERNQRCATVIEADGRRRDRPEFPLKAVREVLLNAIIHRDYSIYTEGTPITLCLFSDRLEVMNKGGLYGRISVDQLGKVHPDTRNPAIAGIMEVLDLAENRYSGIPTIRSEMQQAGLPAPIFTVRDGEFTVTLRSRQAAAPAADLSDPARALLQFCALPRTRAELAAFDGRPWPAVKSRLVDPLIARGLLRLTLPETPKARDQRYAAIPRPETLR